MAKETFPKSE